MRHCWKSCEIRAAGALQRLVFTAMVALVFASAVPSSASALPSRHVTLELAAPAPCPDATELLARIDLQLGADFETDSRLHAVARVLELGASGYELWLRYETDSGAADERRLRGESCQAVTDAAVLVLALALNPSAALPSAAEPVEARQERGQEVRAEPVEPSPPAAERSSLTSARFALLGALDTALMGRSSFGAAVQVGLRVAWFELHARAQLFPPRSAAAGETTTTFHAYSFDVIACTPWQLGRFSVGPCVRAEVGQLAAKVAGPVEAEAPGAARFQALAIGAQVRVRVVAPLWLSLSADFAWFLRRPQFVVTDLGEVLRPAKLGMRAYVGPLLAW